MIDHGDLPELLHHQSSALNITSHPQSLEAEIVSPNDHFEALEDEEPELSCPTSTFDLVSGTCCESLYEKSSLTVSSSSVLIMKYKMRHNLTQEALADLLLLIKLHCPSPNQCLSSVYHFNKQFPDLQYPIVNHYFCNKCLHPVESTTDSRVCSNLCCMNDLSAPDTSSSFIEVPLWSQLKVLLERE